MAGSGFEPADYEPPEVDIWPENWASWVLFDEMSGQWRRAGMAGQAVALDYTPLFARMERLRLSDEEWELRFADVRVMEQAALRQMKSTST